MTDSRYDHVCQQILQQFPEPELAQQMQKGLHRMWSKPPVAEVNSVLKKDLNAEAVREMLFFPTPLTISMYPMLIAGPDRTRIPSLALFYLHHVHNADIMRAFVLSGGMNALVDLMTHENLQFRSQAIDSLRHITSTPHFEWFKRMDDQPDPANAERMFEAMLSLSQTQFLAACLANRTDTFPDGSLFCLQLMAFWLSWIRFHYTSGRLRISKNILDALKSWPAGSQPEADLARDLVEDFGRQAPLEEDEGKMTSLSDHPSLQLSKRSSPQSEKEAVPELETVEPEEAEAAALQQKAEHSQKEEPIEVKSKSTVAANAKSASSSSSSQTQSASSGTASDSLMSSEERLDKYRKLGNDLYGKNEFKGAVEAYSRALELKPDDAKLYGNRAAAKLRLGAEWTSDGVPQRVTSDVDIVSAIRDCQEAILADESYAKAYYRKAQGLLAVNKVEDALNCIKKAAGLAKDDANIQKLARTIEKMANDSGLRNTKKATPAPSEPSEYGAPLPSDTFIPTDLEALSNLLQESATLDANSAHPSGEDPADMVEKMMKQLEQLKQEGAQPQEVKIRDTTQDEKPKIAATADVEGESSGDARKKKKKVIIEEVSDDTPADISNKPRKQ